ncbi:MAG: bifunctional nuclease family protein [Deltaproteobacteria bacterium]|nr:bifunctional nuclease family protein [Deltaproteobacteria bacterium]
MPSKPLELEGLGIEPDSKTPVILLREPESDTQIPIWIGEPEAMAIAAELEDVTPPRPLTHDLLVAVIEQVGFTVEYVEISDLQDGTFHAEIRLIRGDERLTLDARPSDAIALALRTQSKIMVNTRVLEEIEKHGVPASEDEKWTELAMSLTADDFGKYKQ